MKRERRPTPDKPRQRVHPACGLPAERRAAIERSIRQAHDLGKAFEPVKQRGFIEPWMIGALVGIVALIGLFIGAQMYLAHVEDQGKTAGRAEVQAKWDAAKLAQDEQRRLQDKAVTEAFAVLAKQVGDAQRQAESVSTDLEEAKREARRNGIALGGCPGAGQNQAPAGAGLAVARPAAGPGALQAGGAADALRLRLTWEFVREFDGGWSGLDGRSLSPLAGGHLGAELAGAYAPYGLEDAVDVAGLNAKRCSEDRRQFATLISRIRAASAARQQAR